MNKDSINLRKIPHVAGSEYVIEYVNYEVMLIDEKYLAIKTL